MQLPDTLLAAQLPAGAKTVLAALWRRAEGEPAWTGPRVVDIAAAVGLSARRVQQVLAELIERGAVRRETRDAAGRRVRGFGLARSVAPLQKRAKRSAVATARECTPDVVKRDKAHKLTERDDMLAIAAVAGRGCSELHIAKVLINSGTPCSRGKWHNVKVHRRIAVMADECGITTPGMRAGDVVARWRTIAEGKERRKAEAVERATPAARMDFSVDADDEPRRKRA